MEATVGPGYCQRFSEDLSRRACSRRRATANRPVPSNVRAPDDYCFGDGQAALVHVFQPGSAPVGGVTPISP